MAEPGRDLDEMQPFVLRQPHGFFMPELVATALKLRPWSCSRRWRVRSDTPMRLASLSGSARPWASASRSLTRIACSSSLPGRGASCNCEATAANVACKKGSALDVFIAQPSASSVQLAHGWA